MMAMIEDQKEDQWWDLGIEEPEVREEKPEEKTSSAWWWMGFCSDSGVGGFSGIIATSDLGTNPGPHWQSSDHSYVEEFQLTYYNHTLNYTAHSIETPNHIEIDIRNLDFVALEIRTNNFQGEIDPYR